MFNMIQPISLRTLIVEDDHLLLVNLEESLLEIGHTIAAASSDLEAASLTAKTAVYDVAILDVNLNGKLIWPVVEIVKGRNLPFVLMTGYDERVLPDGLNCAVLPKPYRLEMLRDALASIKKPV